MTLKFSTEETVRSMKHVRVLADLRDGLTVDRAFELAQSVVSREWNPGREPGTYVNDLNEVRPIRAPRRGQSESQSIKRLVPVSIESLDDVETEASEVEELLPPIPTPVTGEDTPEEIDEEVEPFENAADIAAGEVSDGDGE